MTVELLPDRKPEETPRRPKVFDKVNKLLESNLHREVSYEQYRDKVREVYGGPKGAILATCSMISLHVPLGERLFRTRKFDLRGTKRILDVGSGAGQLAGHVLKYCDQDAEITCLDLSHPMLIRARQRLKNGRPGFLSADLAHLPLADESYDCITCGYVLEHLPDARTGLVELSRVMTRGGRMFLLTTEDNFGGAWTSRVWCCRTYNRRELYQVFGEIGLTLKQELWFTPVHKVLRAGGICVELVKR